MPLYPSAPLQRTPLGFWGRGAFAVWVAGCAVGCPQPVDTAVNAKAAEAKAAVAFPTGAAPPFEPARIRSEVSALLSAQANDWSAGRLEAFCAAYAEEAVFVSPKGVTRGRAGILARYDKRYRQDGHEMGDLTLTVEDIDAQPNHASVVMKWHLRFAEGPDGGTRAGGPAEAQGHSLVTLRRRDTGAWEVIHDASM